MFFSIRINLEVGVIEIGLGQSEFSISWGFSSLLLEKKTFLGGQKNRLQVLGWSLEDGITSSDVTYNR